MTNLATVESISGSFILLAMFKILAVRWRHLCWFQIWSQVAPQALSHCLRLLALLVSSASTVLVSSSTRVTSVESQLGHKNLDAVQYHSISPTNFAQLPWFTLSQLSDVFYKHWQVGVDQRMTNLVTKFSGQTMTNLVTTFSDQTMTNLVTTFSNQTMTNLVTTFSDQTMTNLVTTFSDQAMTNLVTSFSNQTMTNLVTTFSDQTWPTWWPNLVTK